MFLVGNEKTLFDMGVCDWLFHVYVLTIFLSFNVKRDALIHQIIHNLSIIHKRTFNATRDGAIKCCSMIFIERMFVCTVCHVIDIEGIKCESDGGSGDRTVCMQHAEKKKSFTIKSIEI